MYPGDHYPPHFHVIDGDDEALIRIADIAVVRGGINSQTLDTVRKRVQSGTHQADLALNWVFGQALLAMRKIP